MTPVELSRTVLHAVRSAVADGELDVVVPPRVVVGPPGPGGCGDYATNVALQLARPAGRAPLDVAEILRLRIRETAGVADVEITGPGFLNIRLERAAATAATAALIREVLGRRGGDTPDAPGDDLSASGDQSASGIHDIAGAPGISSTRSTSGTHSTTSTTSTTSTFGTCSTSSTPHPPYGHTTALNGHVIPLRIPYDMRAEVVADALVRIIATQGGRVEVAHVRPGERVDLRPVPAAEDPAPLGPDAARWALLYPAGRDRPRITADHLLQRESNPLFRVRYAHARTRALGRNAARLGFDGVPGEVDVPDAGAVVRALAEYPDVLAQAGAQRAPDRLARHLVVLADALLAVQHTVLPLGDEKPSVAHRARLALAEAAGTVLAGGLSLLGISAPEHL
ncbi:ArgS-related anticodon-binding protein NrtL [Streptomyces nodosus]